MRKNKFPNEKERIFLAIKPTLHTYLSVQLSLGLAKNVPMGLFLAYSFLHLVEKRNKLYCTFHVSDTCCNVKHNYEYSITYLIYFHIHHSGLHFRFGFTF